MLFRKTASSVVRPVLIHFTALFSSSTRSWMRPGVSLLQNKRLQRLFRALLAVVTGRAVLPMLQQNNGCIQLRPGILNPILRHLLMNRTFPFCITSSMNGLPIRYSRRTSPAYRPGCPAVRHDPTGSARPPSVVSGVARVSLMISRSISLSASLSFRPGNRKG